MHLVADLQCSANKLFFELLAHNGLFEDLDEIEMMIFQYISFSNDLCSPPNVGYTDSSK